MRTMSIITTLLFSIERYRITTGSKNRLILSKSNIIILISLVLSMLNCTNKIFEYRIDLFFFAEVEFPVLNIRDLAVNLKANWWFILIYSIHYLLNDFIFLLINFLVDLFLVKHIRQVFSYLISVST